MSLTQHSVFSVMGATGTGKTTVSEHSRITSDKRNYHLNAITAKDEETGQELESGTKTLQDEIQKHQSRFQNFASGIKKKEGATHERNDGGFLM